jgi:hypothetical protein
MEEAPHFKNFSEWWASYEGRTNYHEKFDEVGVDLDDGKGSLRCLKCKKDVIIYYNTRDGQRREGFTMSNATRHVEKCFKVESDARISIDHEGTAITLDIGSLQESDTDAFLSQTTPLLIPAGENRSNRRQERVIDAYKMVQSHPQELELVTIKGEEDDDKRLVLKCKVCIPSRGPTAGNRWYTDVHGTGSLEHNVARHVQTPLHQQKLRGIESQPNMHHFYKAISDTRPVNDFENPPLARVCYGLCIDDATVDEIRKFTQPSAYHEDSCSFFPHTVEASIKTTKGEVLIFKPSFKSKDCVGMSLMFQNEMNYSLPNFCCHACASIPTLKKFKRLVARRKNETVERNCPLKHAFVDQLIQRNQDKSVMIANLRKKVVMQKLKLNHLKAPKVPVNDSQKLCAAFRSMERRKGYDDPAVQRRLKALLQQIYNIESLLRTGSRNGARHTDFSKEIMGHLQSQCGGKATGIASNLFEISHTTLKRTNREYKMHFRVGLEEEALIHNLKIAANYFKLQMEKYELGTLVNTLEMDESNIIVEHAVDFREIDGKMVPFMIGACGYKNGSHPPADIPAEFPGKQKGKQYHKCFGHDGESRINYVQDMHKHVEEKNQGSAICAVMVTSVSWNLIKSLPIAILSTCMKFTEKDMMELIKKIDDLYRMHVMPTCGSLLLGVNSDGAAVRAWYQIKRMMVPKRVTDSVQHYRHSHPALSFLGAVIEALDPGRVLGNLTSAEIAKLAKERVIGFTGVGVQDWRHTGKKMESSDSQSKQLNLMGYSLGLEGLLRLLEWSGVDGKTRDMVNNVLSQVQCVH